jgi:trans-aconitate methyltransferase
VYDLVYQSQGKDYAAEVAELVAQVTGLCPGARSLLDVGCGTGQHLALLGEHFEDLAGVDASAAMLEVASARLPDVELTHGDMREFSLAGRFDVVVSLFSAVGYMADEHELTLAVGAMAAHLNPGGVLVVDGWVRPEQWDPSAQALVESGADGDEAFARFARRRTDGRHTWVELVTVHSTPHGVQQHTEVHQLTLFTEDEYRRAFERAGLSVHKVPSPMPGRDRWIGLRPE